MQGLDDTGRRCLSKWRRWIVVCHPPSYLYAVGSFVMKSLLIVETHSVLMYLAPDAWEKPSARRLKAQKCKTLLTLITARKALKTSRDICSEDLPQKSLQPQRRCRLSRHGGCFVDILWYKISSRKSRGAEHLHSCSFAFAGTNATARNYLVF